MTYKPHPGLTMVAFAARPVSPTGFCARVYHTLCPAFVAAKTVRCVRGERLFVFNYTSSSCDATWGGASSFDVCWFLHCSSLSLVRPPLPQKSSRRVHSASVLFLFPGFNRMFSPISRTFLLMGCCSATRLPEQGRTPSSSRWEQDNRLNHTFKSAHKMRV